MFKHSITRKNVLVKRLKESFPENRIKKIAFSEKIVKRYFLNTSNHALSPSFLFRNILQVDNTLENIVRARRGDDAAVVRALRSVSYTL